MTTDDELLRDLGSALVPEPRTPPPERIAALRAAASSRIPAATETTSIQTHPAWRMRGVAALVAMAAAAFVLGGFVAERGGNGENLLAGGVTEFEVTLVSSDGKTTASATGIRTGIGRIVQLRTGDLPILPTGELYELWFVGPGDAPSSPNRISAGTFHPDEQGRSHVDLTAAVNPEKYPALSVTAEPGDGNPAPTGPEVLRASITLDKS